MNFKKLTLVAGPLLGLLIGGVLRGWGGYPAPLCWTGGITAWVALWWVSESIPIPATSLIPFALFPLCGVLTHNQVARAYGDTLILLFLGGFLLSMAMERSGAHRRLALTMVRCVGGDSGRRLVLGFMVAAAGISMWISNSATALMLLPVALAVLEQTDERPVLAVPLLLGVAYGTSIGGIGTPVGTPPNVVFMAIFKQYTGREWTFLQWMLLGVPIVVLMVPLAWLWLTRNLKLKRALTVPSPGPWRAEEVRVLIVFGIAAALWVTRTEPLGGWDGLVQRLWQVHVPAGENLTGDSTVALLMAAALFVIPDGRGGSLLTWDAAQKLPWGLLLLFGGGLAISAAFKESGLSQEVGRLLSDVTTWNLLAVLVAVCLTMTFLTEITSNTATANILLPVLAGACLGSDGRWVIAPELLMIPAAISASMAFMLPVGTPPNAIVFGTGEVSTRRMAWEGLILNFIGVVVVSLVCYFGLGG